VLIERERAFVTQVIAEVIAEERLRARTVIAEVIAKAMQQERAALESEARQLRRKLSEMKAMLIETNKTVAWVSSTMQDALRDDSSGGTKIIASPKRA
jgi:hypothetical protein